MDKFIPDRKNEIIIASDKLISNRLSSSVRTDDMVSSQPLRLTMRYRFEIFVVKFLCLKVFGRLIFSCCYSRRL